MVTGHGVRARTAAVVALGVGFVSWLLWHLITGGGDLVPRPSWLAAVLLAGMAAFVVGFAWPVRAYLAGRSSRRLDPMRAARAGGDPHRRCCRRLVCRPAGRRCE